MPTPRRTLNAGRPSLRAVLHHQPMLISPRHGLRSDMRPSNAAFLWSLNLITDEGVRQGALTLGTRAQQSAWLETLAARPVLCGRNLLIIGYAHYSCSCGDIVGISRRITLIAGPARSAMRCHRPLQGAVPTENQMKSGT